MRVRNSLPWWVVVITTTLGNLVSAEIDTLICWGIISLIHLPVAFSWPLTFCALFAYCTIANIKILNEELDKYHCDDSRVSDD